MEGRGSNHVWSQLTHWKRNETDPRPNHSWFSVYLEITGKLTPSHLDWNEHNLVFER